MRLAAPLIGGIRKVKGTANTARYKPGQIVPRTGIYKVFHDQHRLMHEATLIEQTRFPTCKRCKAMVRFVLARPANFNVLPFRSTDLLEEWEKDAPLDNPCTELALLGGGAYLSKKNALR